MCLFVCVCVCADESIHINELKCSFGQTHFPTSEQILLIVYYMESYVSYFQRLNFRLVKYNFILTSIQETKVSIKSIGSLSHARLTLSIMIQFVPEHPTITFILIFIVVLSEKKNTAFTLSIY